MKKILSLICILAITIPFSYAQKQSKNIVPGSATKIGSSLPPIKVVDAQGKTYTNQDFKNRHNFFVFLFNPTCGHCMKMARLILEHQDLFNKNSVLFMAAPPTLRYFNNFFKETHLNEFPGIVIGIDSANFITQVYTYATLPQINIYDKNRTLIKTFHGDIPIDSLKSYTY